MPLRDKSGVGGVKVGLMGLGGAGVYVENVEKKKLWNMM